MKKAFRATKWVVLNGLMAWFLWLGAREGVQGAQNVVVFMAWLLAFVTLAAQTDGYIARAKDLPEAVPVPTWLDYTYDFAFTVALVWFGWWWTAGAYLLHVACLGAYRDKAAKEREKRAAANLKAAVDSQT